jgi:arginine deiminase
LALYFSPAFKRTYLVTRERRMEIDIKTYLGTKNMELIDISEGEQKNWGCSFVPLEPKTIIHYDIALGNETRNKLRQRGVELIEFHPDALLAGGGSLRCITLSIWRN